MESSKNIPLTFSNGRSLPGQQTGIKDEAIKTLVILSPGFAQNEDDTTCMPLQQLLIQSLNRVFPSVKIIILAFQYPYFSKSYAWNGNRIISFNGQEKGKFNRILVWVRVWKTLLKLKRENEVIGLFSFWVTECSLIGKYFGIYAGLEYYTWILGQDAKRTNKYVKLVRPKPDSLVALSDFLADEFYKNFGIMPKHLIINGIDPEMFSHSLSGVNSRKNTPSPLGEGRGEADIDILGAGNLTPLKQYDVFIDVMKSLTVKMPELKSRIYGKGPEEMRLKQIVSKYQIRKNLVISGEKPHAEIIALMQRTKVFLHPSSYEGFSTSCLEALYAGCHVISFCKPMKAEIKNWHIVANANEMAKKAYEILHDPYIKYESVCVKTIDEVAGEIMGLFGTYQ